MLWSTLLQLVYRAMARAEYKLPYCHKKDFQSMLNKAMKREIEEFMIFCTHKVKVCEWIGELTALSDHLDSNKGCRYVEVKCTNLGYEMETKEGKVCGVTVQRRFF